MQREVVIFDCARGWAGKGWPPSDPAGFLAWFAAKFAEIPAEHMAEASVDIDADVEYDSAITSIRIAYFRPETVAEANERETKARQQRSDRAERLRMELAQLEAVPLRTIGVNV